MSRKHGPSGLKSHVASEVAYGDVIGYWCIGVLGNKRVGSRQSAVGSIVGRAIARQLGTEVPPPPYNRKRCVVTQTETIHHSSRREVAS